MNNENNNNKYLKNSKLVYSNRKDNQDLLFEINDLKFKIDYTIKHCEDLIGHLEMIVKTLENSSND